MKFYKVLLLVRGFTATILFFLDYFQPEKSGVTTNCPPEYCIGHETDCKCIYNAMRDCYCELKTNIMDCHLNCVAPTKFPKEIDIAITIIASIIFGLIISLIISLIICYIAQIIKLRKLLGKKGEKKRYALVPFRNAYIENKLNMKK